VYVRVRERVERERVEKEREREKEREMLKSNRRSAHSTQGSKCGIYNKRKGSFFLFSSDTFIHLVWLFDLKHEDLQ
jgi:hypothetical protein